MARGGDTSIPTGRLRRTAKLTGLAGGQAARNYATRAANLTRDEDGRKRAASRRQAEAAEQILEVLGNMKGAAMKIGQVASIIDTGAFPEEFQQRIQTKLAELRDSAPRVPFKDMRKVMEEDLGERLKDVFAEFDEEAVAAASIGQVYRARLDDGREVAVKVQYPGVATAVRSDLQNLGLLMRVAKRMAPGMDAKAMAAEIRERISDELDYEQEAQAQRAFARTWRGHPFVVIPEVITELCHERVLVTEWVDGRTFDEVRALDQSQRDRFGEILFRFFFGSLYRHGHFSGDPHPGNFKLMDDGRVAFMDFGMTKRMAPRDIEVELEAIRLADAGDADGLMAHMLAVGAYPRTDDVINGDAVLAHFRDAIGWYLHDEELLIDRDVVAATLVDMGDPRSEHWELMRQGNLPTESILARRMEGLTLGVLGQLGARANWHRIAREWVFGDEPQTELGRAEADFFGSAATIA